MKHHLLEIWLFYAGKLLMVAMFTLSIRFYFVISSLVVISSQCVCKFSSVRVPFNFCLWYHHLPYDYWSKFTLFLLILSCTSSRLLQTRYSWVISHILLTTKWLHAGGPLRPVPQRYERPSSCIAWNISFLYVVCCLCWITFSW